MKEKWCSIAENIECKTICMFVIVSAAKFAMCLDVFRLASRCQLNWNSYVKYDYVIHDYEIRACYSSHFTAAWP